MSTRSPSNRLAPSSSTVTSILGCWSTSMFGLDGTRCNICITCITCNGCITCIRYKQIRYIQEESLTGASPVTTLSGFFHRLGPVASNSRGADAARGGPAHHLLHPLRHGRVGHEQV